MADGGIQYSYWIVASILWILSTLNVLPDEIWFVTVVTNYLNSATLAIIVLDCPAFWRRDTNICIFLCTLTSRPKSLLSSNTILCYFVVFMFYNNKLISSTYTRCWHVPFNSSPSWISWAFLMPYSKGKLKTMATKHLLVSHHSK